MLLVCYFKYLQKNLLTSPYNNHSHGSNCRLANCHLLLASQKRHSSEQGSHLNAHLKKIATHQLWVIKSLVSRLYLLLEKPLTHSSHVIFISFIYYRYILNFRWKESQKDPSKIGLHNNIYCTATLVANQLISWQWRFIKYVKI